MRHFAAVTLVLAGALLAYSAEDDRGQTERWRAAREARLKADGGWLTVAGLFWLQEGANSFGSAAGNAIELPAGPARSGSFELRSGRVTLQLRPGVQATVNGAPARSGMELGADSSRQPGTLKLAGLSLQVLERGGRYAIRLRDPNCRLRKEFSGLHWFPVQESYRVTARLEPHKTGGGVKVTNVLGQTSEMKSPGVVVFRLNGQELRLTPVLEDDGTLFFIFRDATAGRQTYGAGRFLYAEPARNGKIILDFNRAENPPCAFTPYATCPLPPRENRLAVPIAAGEKVYHHGPAR